MTLSHLTYTVDYQDISNNILQVNLVITSPSTQKIDLFKGKIKVTSFRSNCHYTENAHFYSLDATKAPLAISYCVQIGTPAKHGYIGDITEHLTVFSGDQVFLFPSDLLTSDNSKPSPYTITLNFAFPDISNCLIPFASSTKESPTSSCSGPTWSHMYELMKSPFIFGHLRPIEVKDLSPHLDIFLESDFGDLEPTVIQAIQDLYHYYAHLFDTSSHRLTLVLLSCIPRARLGGCGAHMICSSFDPSSLRDWQLLSHRMFHSFMDSLLPISDFHMPPNLWLTEGLATYYENMALSALNMDFRVTLGLDLDKEFNRLFTRYLYMKQKPHSVFVFPPMAERDIRSAGKLEFLHYTHAPLIIKYLEDDYSTSSDQLLKLLLKIDMHSPFSMEKLFTTLLGYKVNTFATSYLFGDYLIPLWDLRLTNTFSRDEIIEDLNYFEYLLSTWMILEDSSYHPDQIPNHILSEYSYHKVHIPSVFKQLTLSDEIQVYSPHLHEILRYLHSTAY